MNIIIREAHININIIIIEARININIIIREALININIIIREANVNMNIIFRKYVFHVARIHSQHLKAIKYCKYFSFKGYNLKNVLFYFLIQKIFIQQSTSNASIKATKESKIIMTQGLALRSTRFRYQTMKIGCLSNTNTYLWTKLWIIMNLHLIISANNYQAVGTRRFIFKKCLLSIMTGRSHICRVLLPWWYRLSTSAIYSLELA